MTINDREMKHAALIIKRNCDPNNCERCPLADIFPDGSTSCNVATIDYLPKYWEIEDSGDSI